MSNNFNVILELYGRIVYSHKTHEKAIERLTKKTKNTKLVQIILLSITSAGIIGSLTDLLSPLFNTYSRASIYYNLVIIGLTLVATGFSIFDLCSSDKDDLYSHKVAASKFLYIRDKYLVLIADYKDKLITDHQLLEHRDKLYLELSKLHDECPKTTKKDYNNARKALKENDEYTFDLHELEKFLPVYMRNISNANIKNNTIKEELLK
ncbi:SLATT domain-containing protein [Heyndrickxia oleronia]|uniref:SLATT domain-containing protein n=1 Tax=Heyndrickxia oleronia TaxID=38875 RepID=UPI003F24FD1B